MLQLGVGCFFAWQSCSRPGLIAFYSSRSAGGPLRTSNQPSIRFVVQLAPAKIRLLFRMAKLPPLGFGCRLLLPLGWWPLTNKQACIGFVMQPAPPSDSAAFSHCKTAPARAWLLFTAPAQVWWPRTSKQARIGFVVQPAPARIRLFFRIAKMLPFGFGCCSHSAGGPLRTSKHA